MYRVHEGRLERQAAPAQRTYGGDAPVSLDTVALVPAVDAMQVRVWRPNVGWITPVGDADSANAAGVEVNLQRHDGSTLRRVFLVG
jgi:hypothetical protein